ncbi:MAG: motility associated factor glycosyltransferase family protein [Spirochaetales bacterium]|nr:motility associated factor glycosyltransferase family protein [Spirochaetales bacterium]
MIQILKAKNGLDTLLIDGRYIHSAYRPDSDGANVRLDKHKLYILFGVGLGYMAANIIRNNPGASLIIFEPLSELADKFRSAYHSILHSSSVLLITEIEYDPIYNFINEQADYGSKRIEFISTPYCDIMSDTANAVLESIRKIYEIYVQNLFTRSNFAQLWTRNHIYNLAMLPQVPLCRIDRDSDLSDNLAVIVGAGPTLDREWDNLTNLRQQLTIICVDTAIKPLLRHSIMPDFIMTLDGQIYSLDDFTAFIPSESYIISEMTSYHQINRGYNNVKFVMNYDKTDNFAKYFLRIADSPIDVTAANADEYFIPISGTVADFALKFAAAVGFRHIALLGIDLSYPQICTHARHTPAYNKLWSSADYFATLDTQNARIISARKLTTVHNKNGGETLSDFVLSHYADGFSGFAAVHPDISLYNIISDGADIRFVQNISLIELTSRLSTKCQQQYIASHILHDSKISSDSINKAQQSVLQQVYQYSERLKTLYAQTDWTDVSSLREWDSLTGQLYADLPFMRDFVIMQNVIHARQTDSDPLNELSYYRNAGFILLQACYFVVRTLQKAISFCTSSATE